MDYRRSFLIVSENKRDPLPRIHFWVFLSFGASLEWSSVTDPRCIGVEGRREGGGGVVRWGETVWSRSVR